MTEQLKHPSQLLRFVKGSDGLIWFDLSGKAEGESVYLSPECWKDDGVVDFLEKKLAATVCEGFVEQTEKNVMKRSLQQLGLLKKAGRVTLGAAQVNSELKERKVKAVLLAEDAGKDVFTKSQNWLKYGADVCVFGKKDQFSSALGVENCAVVGLSIGCSTWTGFEVIETLIGMKLARRLENS